MRLPLGGAWPVVSKARRFVESKTAGPARRADAGRAGIVYGETGAAGLAGILAVDGRGPEDLA